MDRPRSGIRAVSPDPELLSAVNSHKSMRLARQVQVFITVGRSSAISEEQPNLL
jgi:hypothetical protein